jgi:hypothetical protein
MFDDYFLGDDKTKCITDMIHRETPVTPGRKVLEMAIRSVGAPFPG